MANKLAFWNKSCQKIMTIERKKIFKWLCRFAHTSEEWDLRDGIFGLFSFYCLISSYCLESEGRNESRKDAWWWVLVVKIWLTSVLRREGEPAFSLTVFWNLTGEYSFSAQLCTHPSPISLFVSISLLSFSVIHIYTALLEPSCGIKVFLVECHNL